MARKIASCICHSDDNILYQLIHGTCAGTGKEPTVFQTVLMTAVGCFFAGVFAVIGA